MNENPRNKFALVLIVSGIVFMVLCAFELSKRIGLNDELQREAKMLLAGYRSIASQAATNLTVDLPRYTVNGREGTVVLLQQKLSVDGKQLDAEVGWTNSCLGPGVLIYCKDGRFVWRDSFGQTRKIDIPELDNIPLSWYLTNP